MVQNISILNIVILARTFKLLFLICQTYAVKVHSQHCGTLISVFLIARSKRYLLETNWIDYM